MSDLNVYEENYKLKKKIERLESVIRNVNGWLYCIGGPLNDNYHQFNKDQLKYCFKLSEIIKGETDE